MEEKVQEKARELQKFGRRLGRIKCKPGLPLFGKSWARDKNKFPVYAYTSKKPCARKGYGVPLAAAAQAKLAASVVSPVPLYLATCGYGHKGRVITGWVPSFSYFGVIIMAGATPFSTHCSSARYTSCCGSPPVRAPA